MIITRDLVGYYRAEQRTETGKLLIAEAETFIEVLEAMYELLNNQEGVKQWASKK